MSCGRHHDKDCAEVLENLFLFLDHETQEAVRRAQARIRAVERAK